MEEEVKTRAPETEEAAAAPSEKPEPSDKPKKKKDKTNPQLEELKARLAEQEDTYKRMLAEYANYKRRTEQEKEQIGRFTTGRLLTALLPVLDNLERAAAAPEGEEYKAGVEMIVTQFQKALSDMGLAEIPAENAPFDPELHHAVMREDADGVEPDTVTQVFQKGYKLGDKVLRPAMVKVAN